MGRKHVFVVDGAPSFLDFVRELLQGEDYNVTTTNYVPRTFEQIEALRPDLLIIDLVIGVQAGWDLLERLQDDAIMSRVPVIVASTDQRLLDRAQDQQARYGSWRYVAKPFDLDVLMDSIRSLIGGP